MSSREKERKRLKKRGRDDEDLLFVNSYLAFGYADIFPYNVIWIRSVINFHSVMRK